MYIHVYLQPYCSSTRPERRARALAYMSHGCIWNDAAGTPSMAIVVRDHPGRRTKAMRRRLRREGRAAGRRLLEWVLAGCTYDRGSLLARRANWRTVAWQDCPAVNGSGALPVGRGLAGPTAESEQIGRAHV